MAQGLDKKAGNALLAWYDKHGRSLPWRTAQGEADPYGVWLSEVMLQQTTVTAVIPYYERFLARWPTVEALAAAEDDELMAAWAGLGYYARARNLLACARAVSGRGFPGSAAALRALPGVGAYTSSAVAAIAFGERVPVVDGNVERVVSRLIALDTPPKVAVATVTAAVEAMLPTKRPGDFAQAMMDLGAAICTPKSPACGICPIRTWCTASKAGTAIDYPKKAPKKAKKVWEGVSFVVVAPGNKVLMRKRPPKGMLGGMLEAPGSGWGGAPENPFVHAPLSARWEEAGAVTHGFTHADLTLSVYTAKVPRAVRVDGCDWYPSETPVATLTRKVLTRGLAALGPSGHGKAKGDA